MFTVVLGTSKVSLEFLSTASGNGLLLFQGLTSPSDRGGILVDLVAGQIRLCAGMQSNGTRCVRGDEGKRQTIAQYFNTTSTLLCVSLNI